MDVKGKKKKQTQQAVLYQVSTNVFKSSFLKAKTLNILARAQLQFHSQLLSAHQDPTSIQHQTAPSGDTYAVVDKPKRGSSKKREPGVFPPRSGGVSYFRTISTADDLSSLCSHI